MHVNAVPVPLPGHTQPPLNPVPAWAGKDLVRVNSELVMATRTKPMDVNFHGITSASSHGQAGFQRVESGSFREAVEAASALAAKHPVAVNFEGIDPAERSVSSAIAVLQATDGAYYATGLAGLLNRGEVYSSIDTGRSNLIVHDVEQLHPDVRAVVGAYSWVNFTGEDITPTMAG